MIHEYKYGTPNNGEDLLDEIQNLCSRAYRNIPQLERGSTIDHTVQVDYRERGFGKDEQTLAWVRVGLGRAVEIPVADLTKYLIEHIGTRTILWEQRPFYKLVEALIGFSDEDDLWKNYGADAFQRAGDILDEWTAIGVQRREG
jgi:hypothetical protein